MSRLYDTDGVITADSRLQEIKSLHQRSGELMRSLNAGGDRAVEDAKARRPEVFRETAKAKVRFCSSLCILLSVAITYPAFCRRRRPLY